MHGAPLSFDIHANRRLALRLGARALVVWTIVCVTALAAQRPLTAMLLPFFEAAISLLQQDFAATLRLVEIKGQSVIQMTPFLLRPVSLTDQLALRPFVPLASFPVSVDHALVPLVLLITGVASWPFASSREAAVRMLMTIAALPLVLALSTPVLLVGRQQMLFVEAALRQGARFHEPGLVTLMIFMESGGRWLLPLGLAIACVVASRRLWFKPAKASPVNPGTAASNAAELAFPPV